MKTIIIYIMSATILLQSMNYAVIFLSFTINRDYIAEILCINRDKPEMKCNGHCQLTKKIKESKTKEKKMPVKPDEKSFTFYISPRQVINLVSGLRLFNKNTFLNFKSKPRSFIPDIFHPPKPY